MIIDAVKILLPAAIAFFVGIAVSAAVTPYLYKYRMWKKQAGKRDLSGAATPIFDGLHREKEIGTPKLGGIIIWLSILLTAFIIWLVSVLLPNEMTEKLSFLSRSQTWIPLFTLIAGSLVGMIDDCMEIYGNGDHVAGGLSLRKRLIVVGMVGLIGALWFYFKLDVSSVGLPGYFGQNEIELGALFIPFFIAVMLLLYSGGVIDGLDGLAGGIFAVMYSAYAGIAFYQNQINLAAFCAVVAGGVLAFLWFNIPPARYYMSETGTMGLTITLAVVAFLTDTLAEGHGLLALPIIALPLMFTTLSVVVQVGSKRLRRGKKVFLIAPLHHHFEARGWPSYKVTMRYWILSVIFALIGMLFALIG